MLFLSGGRMGVVHQEKFWKENARLLEANNFKLLKELIKLLKNDDVVSDILMILLDCIVFMAV